MRPPAIENGTLRSTSPASRAERKVAYKRTKIRAMVTGMIIMSR